MGPCSELRATIPHGERWGEASRLHTLYSHGWEVEGEGRDAALQQMSLFGDGHYAHTIIVPLPHKYIDAFPNFRTVV